MADDAIKRIVGPTILLRSGEYFDFESPEASNITIIDIATGLSHICRFTGQCHSFYSVAEHSVLCSHLVPPGDAFAALMHDAAEAVMGDVSRPLKSLLPDYKRIEKRVEAAILAKWGLSAVMPPSVKIADRQMLGVEQRQCMMNHDEWPVTVSVPTGEPEIRFLAPEHAFAEFISRYNELRPANDPL